ncbi:MAG: hypothetical protein PVH19_09265 [Planctomycetia bacterium]
MATDSQGIIGELEVLQNDLLARLDDLNHRVETVIQEWTTERKTEKEAEPVVTEDRKVA